MTSVRGWWFAGLLHVQIHDDVSSYSIIRDLDVVDDLVGCSHLDGSRSAPFRKINVLGLAVFCSATRP